MIHTLNTITLSDFIKVYFGDYSYAGSKEETNKDKENASLKMISEYMEIVGGNSIIYEIKKQNELLNNELRIRLMDACDVLMKLQQYGEVSRLLKEQGYSVKPDDIDGLNKRILSIRSVASTKIKMSQPDKKEEKKIDEDYFVKERSFLISHYKMYIDPDQFKAKEYAYLVDRMRRELKDLSKIGKK